MTDIQSFTGGTENDTFTFNGAFQLTGTTGIDGGGGSNTLTAPNVNNSWTVTGNNTGTITPTGAPGATNFTNIPTITGGTGNDTFTFNGAYQISGTTGIDGGGGTNTLKGPNLTTTWGVAGATTGTITPMGAAGAPKHLSLIHISEPTRPY